MKNRVAVVIVNWNSGPMLYRVVKSVLQTGEVEDIVVVDNASSDGSLNALTEITGPVRVIENDSNLGFARAINQGFNATTLPLVLILNPDIQAKPGAIAGLTETMEAHSEIGAIGGFVNSNYPPRPFPTLLSLFRENIGLPRLETKISGAQAMRVDQSAGAALMVRRTAFDSVGGFDGQFYPAWYEDVDFCRAISSVGWEIYFHPGAHFQHSGGYSIETLGFERFLTSYYRNQLRYAQKHLHSRAGLLIKTGLVIGMLLKMVYRPRMCPIYWRVLSGVL